MKRRDFLKRSALTLGAIAFTGKEAMAQKIREDHNMPGMIHEGMEMKPEQMIMHEPIGWADPNITILPPPPLMGRQLGRVHTPNELPLSDEIDGKVKGFTV